MKQCALCNGKTVPASIKDYVYDTNLGDIVIKGVSKLDQCTECKNIFVSGQQMDQWNKELLRTLASKKRTLKPKEMIFAFSVLPYSQNEIAEAVGKDKSTLSKYKTGENRPDHSFDFLLKKIMRDYSEDHEKTMNELREAYEREGLGEDTEITSVAASPCPASDNEYNHLQMERKKTQINRLRFKLAGRSPVPWLFLASELKDQADSLRSTSSTRFAKGYSLLLAFAFENLIKALLIEEKGHFSSRLADHRLAKLIDLHGKIPLSREDRTLLTALENIIWWAGRYPIPKKISPSIDFNICTKIFTSRDKTQRLWNELLSFLLEQTRPELERHSGVMKSVLSRSASDAKL